MVNVRYRSAADLGPRPTETPPSPEGEGPPSAVQPPFDPTAWTPAMVIVAIFLAIFAFLLGSAHMGNSDVWLTLATGRLLHHGEYHFGVDPFSWASEGAYWANSSWLGSWLFYLAYLSGNATLGIAKAVVVLAMAGLLVGTRSRSSSLSLTMSFAAMALLSASPRFLAQTTMFSFLGVALLLWILVHDGHLDVRDRPTRRFVWFIPLLFLAWSNLDGYYILGLYVLIATAGCRFFASEGRAEGTRLALVSAASVVACALNPHLLANFELPGELSYWLGIGDSGRALALLQATEPSTFGLMSSMSTNYLSWPNFGWNVAGMAFNLLFLFNLGSFFAVAASSVRTPGLLPRAAIAGGLGLLALLQWTFIPFYALVAGPITVLNLTDSLRARRSTTTRSTSTTMQLVVTLERGPDPRHLPGVAGLAAHGVRRLRHESNVPGEPTRQLGAGAGAVAEEGRPRSRGAIEKGRSPARLSAGARPGPLLRFLRSVGQVRHRPALRPVSNDRRRLREAAG